MMDWTRDVPLSPDRDDKHAPDWALDHPMAGYGGFPTRPGCEVASIEALNEASQCTGREFDWYLDDDEFDKAQAEGEAWGDQDAQ